MATLFGFSIKDKDPKLKAKGAASPVPPVDNDATSTITPFGGWFGHYVDLDDSKKRDEINLIRRYRQMALQPEVDSAIEDITNEAIVSDKDDSPVEIELSNLEASDSIKKSIRDEFDHIKKLLDVDKAAHQIFRRWFIDGRMFYHKVVDLEDPSKGILELRWIDPLKIKKLRIVEKPPMDADQFMKYDYGKTTEFYIYNEKGVNNTNQGIKIADDAIAYITSGVKDQGKNIVLSYLHKAIKYLNQLRMLEDSIVIYRLSRAPERRIFYIDVGNLPKIKAEQYLRDVMSRYRNKLVYDSNTGEIRDDKKHMSMLEDFWLPRREGGRGTEITTLPGGQNLGELTDIKYFQTQLYKALNVPPSRLESDKSFDLGKSEEINRDEIKFTKFVGRLRKKFSDLFHDLLKTQLILKGVITPDDWEDMKEHIQYDYLYDNHFSELKDLEMLQKKMEVLNELDLYVGKYFSQDYVMRQLLQFTEQEIVEMRAQIDSEIKLGLVMDPVAQLGQEQETADLEQEMQRAQIDNMKQPPLPPSKGNGNKNAK
tara:strand:- start:1468 stop:3084 length:1617 start_codon:yes stop_codon:yes gene_type:complete